PLARTLRRLDRVVDGGQDGGMQRLVEPRDLAIVAIDREEVLDQVVRADREEVDLPDELRRERDRGRDLDHHADRHRGVEVASLLAQLLLRLLEQLLHLPDLLDARDHREEHPDPTRGGHAEDRAQLHLEEFRHLERDADRAPAEERVLLPREAHVPRILVRADVERPDRERPALHAADDAHVELVLLLLVGELAVREERKLRAVEADPLRAVPVGEDEVRDEADVRVERYAAAVGGLCRDVLDALELAIEGAILAIEPVVLARDVDRRIDVDDPRVAVDDHVVVLVHDVTQLLDADDGRDLERLREDRRVRGDAA